MAKRKTTENLYNHYPSDEELLERIRKGDPTGMELMLEKYKDLVKSNARSLFLLGGEKEDLIQEGMIALYQATYSYEKDRGVLFYTYADRCISNRMKTAIRDSNCQKHIPLNTFISFYGTEESAESSSGNSESGQKAKSLLDILEAGASSDPMQIALAEALSKYLSERIAKELSEFEQAALDLYVTGETSGSAAAILGKSPKATDNAIGRAKKKVATMLKEWNEED